MNKEIIYNEHGHAIDPRKYDYWNELTQSEKNKLYARYVFICEQER